MGGASPSHGAPRGSPDDLQLLDVRPRRTPHPRDDVIDLTGADADHGAVEIVRTVPPAPDVVYRGAVSDRTRPGAAWPAPSTAAAQPAHTARVLRQPTVRLPPPFADPPKARPKDSTISVTASPPAGSAVRCAICLDAYSHPVATPCGHVFCEACAVLAVRQTRACPTCRKQVASARKLKRLYM